MCSDTELIVKEVLVVTKRIVRRAGYSITLELPSEEFLHTPRPDQRNWILNKVLKEAADDLDHANSRTGDMVQGAALAGEISDVKTGFVDPERIMENWQIPIMERMAQLVCSPGTDILEVGYGRGVAAGYVQQQNPKSHTIIECNPHICNDCRAWVDENKLQGVTLLPNLWQEVVDDLDTYDGILFHTYPVDEEDFALNVGGSSTFAEHFFEPASKLLKPGGRLTYLTLESDSLGRNHQRALFKHFSSFRLSKMEDLAIPDETADALWIPSLVMVEVVK